MELQHPFHAITTSVDGDVLRVLAGADSAFAISTLVHLMRGRSVQGVRNSLERLAEQGIVLIDETTRTRTYRLNRAHLLADAIMNIADVRTRFLAKLRERLAAASRLFEYAALYGSAARGDMRPDSDIDILLVRSPTADLTQVDAFAADLERDVASWTGNLASLLVVAAADVGPHEPVFASIRDEGIAIGAAPDWLSTKLQGARR